MDKIIIYTADGSQAIYEAPISRDSKEVCRLMGEHYVELRFKHTTMLPFKRGCYITYRNSVYTLKKDAAPEALSSADGYQYALQFYARQHLMEHRIFRWLTGKNNEVTFHLTTTLEEYAKLLVANMNAYMSGVLWAYESIPEGVASQTKALSFDGISCWDALSSIATEFGVEWWVTEISHLDRTAIKLNFGKCAIGDYAEVREGEVVKRFPPARRGDDANFGTRYYVFGGTKNLPDDYLDNTTGGTTNHISEKRLHLPNGLEYIDAVEGLSGSQIIEKTIILDDIFPKNTEYVSEIRTVEREIIEGEKQGTAYVVVCDNTAFHPADMKIGTLGVTFTSGALNGRSFDVSITDTKLGEPFDKQFEIIAQVEGEDGSSQIIIPNEYLKPAVGDSFILTGVKLPDEKVRFAENELLVAGTAMAREYYADTNVYDCATNPVYCNNADVDYALGQRVHLIGAQFGEEGRQSRVQGYDKLLYDRHQATYSIGDNALYSRSLKLAKELNNATLSEVKAQKREDRSDFYQIKLQSAGALDMTNQVNVLIGKDKWMSAREIAEDVVEANVSPTLNSHTKDISDIKSDYLRKDDTADFATDLTGVPEATQEEFTYRPSAGRKSIRDKSAVIRGIKGNSLVWNQIYPTDWTKENYSKYEEDTSVGVSEHGIISINGHIKNNYGSFEIPYFKKQQLNYKYLFVCEIIENPNDIQVTRFGLFNRQWNIAFNNKKAAGIYIETNVDEGRGCGIYFNSDDIDVEGLKIRVNHYNLTKMFDAGNEPVTVEEFYARIPEGIDINAYNEGQIISMNANAIETTGFNQFNGTYAKVIGGQTYYLGGTYTSVGFTAKLDGTIEAITIPSDSLYSPTQSGYIYASGENICINLSHSGIRDGEYEPYWKSINDLSVIKKYFRDGMRSAGSAYDEIVFDKSREKWVAIQRIGSVDLGSLNWDYTSKEGEQRYVSYGLQGIINVPNSNRDVANTRTTRYLATYFNGMWDNTLDKTLAVHTNGAVAIKDLSYTNATTFKNSLQGVMLYYELAEPVVTEIDDVVDFAYAIDDFGTERILSDGASAPFKADIVYQFNAEGRIRDNSRNIDSLEGRIQTLYLGEDTTGSIANTIKRNTISFDKLSEVSNADGLIKGRDTKAYIDAKCKTVDLEDASTSQETDGLVMAKDAIDFFSSRYAKPSDIASLEDYVNDELDKKLGKNEMIDADKVAAIRATALGLAHQMPVSGAKVKGVSANSLADIKADEFFIEKSLDGGVTWNSVDHDTPKIRSMFYDMGFSGGFQLSQTEEWPSGSKFRITIYPKTSRNIWVDYFAITMYCNARHFNISGEYCPQNDGGELEWTSFSTPYKVNDNCVAIIGYKNYFGFRAFNHWGVRFTFEVVREHASTSRVVSIAGYGNKPCEVAATVDNALWTIGTPYLQDEYKNVSFPEKVVARSFEDRDGNAVMLAKDIPTEVATATQKIVGTSDKITVLLPNVMYEITDSISGEFRMPQLFVGDVGYDNVWMIRILTAMSDLTINFRNMSVRTTGYIDIEHTCCLELYLRQGSDGIYYCDWKTYN